MNNARESQSSYNSTRKVNQRETWGIIFIGYPEESIFNASNGTSRHSGFETSMANGAQNAAEHHLGDGLEDVVVVGANGRPGW